MDLLPEKSIAIFAAAPVKMMTDVVPYPFRQDADYLYITGCQQPGGVAVLSHEFGLCMFMPEADPHVRSLYARIFLHSTEFYYIFFFFGISTAVMASDFH